MISKSTIERIKDLPIADVISHYIDLKKNGSGYKAPSPFTDEKTPSFFVVPAKNIFKCFSTGKGGDAIRFVMEHQNLNFIDAIKEIAGKCGERIEYDTPATPEDKQQADHREVLYKLNEATARQYQKQLATLLEQRAANLEFIHPAIDEIVKRKFTFDTLAQWQIGFAPIGDKWNFITNLIGDKHYAEAIELGLIKKSEKSGTTYDAWRNRVMYPIHDQHGRIVGFGGRALAPDEHNPKYLNSGESKIYRKDETLYGLHFAHAPIRKHGYAYMMEGYTDVISFHQAGFNCTVGTCGTSLTESQCKLLKKYCSKVILFPDPDKAGEASALRSIDLLMKQGFEVAVVPMPQVEGKKVDPDELTRMFKSN
jgi:DNA primase